MAVVRPIGPLVPIIFERDEGTGRRRVRAEPSVRHPVDDTREDWLDVHAVASGRPEDSKNPHVPD
jgi:hypothetical protein